MATYEEDYARSLEDPEGFWGDAAKGISWYKKWDRVLDDSNSPFSKWFPGGELNTCYNCLDRHVEAGRGDQAALIYDSPMTGQVKSFTYAELTDLVARFAGGLDQMGIKKGDRVIIYMPMVPEAAIAMLACARIGAIHSVVFGGFAANELATRIDDAKPVAILAASCGLEPGRVVEYKPLLDEAIEISSHKPENVVILQRPECQASMIDGRIMIGTKFLIGLSLLTRFLSRQLIRFMCFIPLVQPVCLKVSSVTMVVMRLRFTGP